MAQLAEQQQQADAYVKEQMAEYVANAHKKAQLAERLQSELAIARDKAQQVVPLTSGEPRDTALCACVCSF